MARTMVEDEGGVKAVWRRCRIHSANVNCGR